MRLKVFTLPYEPERGFDDMAMQEFVADKHVISVIERFFEHEGAPVWALLLSYREPERAVSVRPAINRQNKPDWRQSLAEPDRPLYDVLRTWRNALAEKQGIPRS